MEDTDKYPWLDDGDERKYMTDKEVLERYIHLDNSCLNKWEKKEVMYNVLLINWYIGNITIKCHNKSMGDNRDPTVILHQEIFTLPVSIASDTRCF